MPNCSIAQQAHTQNVAIVVDETCLPFGEICNTHSLPSTSLQI
jgi:hypothetical protein